MEMHGSINQLVCSECAAVAAMTPAALRALRGKRGIPCHACDAASLRVRIMLYDDAEGAPALHGCLSRAPGQKGNVQSLSCVRPGAYGIGTV